MSGPEPAERGLERDAARAGAVYRADRLEVPRASRNTPGLQAVVATMFLLGMLFLAFQLWLLTASLELVLSGAGRNVWVAIVLSGLVFAGGVAALWMLERDERRPR